MFVSIMRGSTNLRPIILCEHSVCLSTIHSYFICCFVIAPENREKTKADKHLERLLEDEKRMTEMLEQLPNFNFGNNVLTNTHPVR